MVLVYRTSILTEEEAGKFREALDGLAGNGAWNFDLEDRDHILRLETDISTGNKVEELIRSAGYVCCELEDSL